jgi:hypothetical protein
MAKVSLSCNESSKCRRGFTSPERLEADGQNRPPFCLREKVLVMTASPGKAILFCYVNHADAPLANSAP